MEPVEHMVHALIDHMGGVATSQSVAGEPIELGGFKIVVLSMISAGMGTGGGSGRGDAPAKKGRRDAGPGEGAAEGAGGGVKVRPAAIVAFGPAGVQVLPIPAPPGVFDKVIDKVPDVVEMVEHARDALA